MPDRPPQLSIIIPAYNEAAHIGPTVRAARDAAATLGEAYEVIVVNDASEDDTAARAAAAGARVVDVRCRQISATRNAGAAAAAGDVLVFVDADTLLPRRTLAEAWAALQRGAVAGGAPVAFDQGASAAGRFAVSLWNLTSRVMNWAAGSFLFARKGPFDAVGGFDERYYAAEELLLSDALKRLGPFAIVGCPVVTSSRKERTHTWTSHFILLAKVVLTRGRCLRRRDGLHIWYDGQRETASS